MPHRDKKNGNGKHSLPFRDTAAAFTAFLVVIAFIAIGFLTMGTEVITGLKVTAPGDWLAAMLSLASAALGYLIGKQPDALSPVAPPPAFDPGFATDPAVCSCCGQPLPSNNAPEYSGRPEDDH